MAKAPPKSPKDLPPKPKRPRGNPNWKGVSGNPAGRPPKWKFGSGDVRIFAESGEEIRVCDFSEIKKGDRFDYAIPRNYPKCDYYLAQDDARAVRGVVGVMAKTILNGKEVKYPPGGDATSQPTKTEGK